MMINQIVETVLKTQEQFIEEWNLTKKSTLTIDQNKNLD